MAEWEDHDLYRYDKLIAAWFSPQLNDGDGGCVWVVCYSEGWCIEPGEGTALLAGPFETKEAAMLAAELMFE